MLHHRVTFRFYHRSFLVIFNTKILVSSTFEVIDLPMKYRYRKYIYIYICFQIKLHNYLSLPSFYRYVLEPEISFSADSSFAPGPMAKFLDMPQSPLFTLNLNTPESWMVESVHTRYDLDNIYLEEASMLYFTDTHSQSQEIGFQLCNTYIFLL